MPKGMTFEQNMEAMSKMSPDEMKTRLEEMTKMCVCGKCPSYIDTGEKKLLFCATGKSAMIKKEKGCICPGCPVTENVGLKWIYYCTKGSGKEQAGLQKK
jgi:Zn finger protein HypA/HybF involved in hydrogenase expression